MPNYLTVFRPICSTGQGRQNIRINNIPSFIDGSIRREPDFQHNTPIITSLCRNGRISNRLNVGDRIYYITPKIKTRNGVNTVNSRYLVAILEVTNLFDSHMETGNFFENHGLALPSNCIVAGNNPLPLNSSAGLPSNFRSIHQWDASYRYRSIRNGRVLLTDVIFRCLNNPPAIDLPNIFNISNKSLQGYPKVLDNNQIEFLNALTAEQP